MNLGSVATKVLDFISDDNGNGSTEFSNKIKKAYNTNFDLAGTFEVETFMCNAQLTGFLDGISNDFSGVRNSLSDGITGKSSGFLDGIVNTATNAISSVSNTVTNAISSVSNTVTNAIGNFSNTVLGIIDLDFLDGPIQDLSKKLTGQRVNINSDVKLMGILIKSVSVQDINSADLQEYMGSGWTNSIGRHELGLVTFTLYDVNGAYIYNLFKAIYANLKFAYPDDQKWTLKVRKKTFLESVRGTKQKSGYIINTNNAILMSIGGYNVDQSNTGLAEFQVTFKYDPFPNQ